MKHLVAILLLSTAFLALGHAGDYSVNVLGKTNSTEAINVEGAWRTDLSSRFRVSLRSSKETPGSSLLFKVYYFDADGKILRKQDGPNKIWTSTKKGTAELGMPEILKTGQVENVYVAIPPEVDKMKALVIVFGSGDSLSYDIYPGSKKIEDLDFPEKTQVKK